MERPKTIGVFAGLLNKEGELLLQRRTEKKSSIVAGKSFQGDWELPGGRVKEKDLRKALTLEVLWKELRREVKEELGVKIPALSRANTFAALYLAVFKDEDKGINDWAIMFPVFHWERPKRYKRKIIFVDPEELKEIALGQREGQLVSGWGKRMCRMSLGALCHSSLADFGRKAMEMLDEIRPGWMGEELMDFAQFEEIVKRCS